MKSSQNIVIRKCTKCGSEGEERHHFSYCGNGVWRCHYCASMYTEIQEIRESQDD